MSEQVHKDVTRELLQDLKGGRVTRYDFFKKALALGMTVVAADQLLEAHPALAMTKAERELKAAGKNYTYWTPFAGADGPHMKLMTDRYNAAHPGTYFTFVRVGGGYETKMTSAAISHTLPDVAAYRLDWIPDAVARGIFEPIDDIARAQNLTASDFAPAVWNGGLQNGHRYSIPLDTHVAVFWWNNAVVKQAGLSSPPTNMTEFMAVVNGAKKAGKIGFPVSIGWPLPLQFTTFLWQNGGELFTADKKAAAYNSAAGQQALSFLVNMVTSGGSPKGMTDEGNVAFLNNKAAMWIDGIWWLQGIKDAKLNYGAGPVPTLFKQPAAWSGSHQLVLPKKTRSAADRAALGRFISYVVANSAEWAKGGQVPASKKVRESGTFHSIQPQYAIAQEENYVRFVDPFPGASQAFYGPLQNYGGQAVNGKLSVKAALDKAVAESNKILTSARASFGAGSGD